MDPRPSRTRAAIREAALRLGAERDGAFSVHDIARAAGVSRASFYAHFPTGLEDVAVDLLERFAEHLEHSVAGDFAAHPPRSREDGMRRTLEHLLSALDARREFFRSMSQWKVGSRVREALIDIVARLIAPQSAAASDRAADEGEAMMQARLSASGVVSVATAWIRDREAGAASAPEVVVGELLELLRDRTASAG